MFWLNCTRGKIKGLEKNRVVILPIGSCEQHGTHLPVGTDTYIGECILKKISKIIKSEVVILPYIWFGFSNHHMDFKGTITLNNETLVHLIVDLCESIYKNEFKKIILFNSHGGNMPALQLAVNEIGVKFNSSPILFSYWNFLRKDIKQIRKSKLGGIGHAGELETSLAKYLFSEYMEEIPRDVSYNSNKYFTYDMFASKLYYTYKKFNNISPTGLIGDPGLSSMEEGKRLFYIIVKNIKDFILYYRKNEL